MDISSKIYVAGHTGLVGSAVVDELSKRGYTNLVTVASKDLDLRDAAKTARFFREVKPEFVFHAAALVGGIEANKTRPAEFLFDNLRMQSNVLDSARNVGVNKLLFYGSNCMYPRECPQPMSEEHLLTGRFEPTNAAYSAAKMAGLAMCQAYNSQYGTDFIVPIPANLFGPNDNFDPKQAHFFSALIKKFHDAKEREDKGVVLWGTGTSRREALYSKDLADASIFLMENYTGSEPINVGTSTDYSVRDIAGILKEVIGFEGDIEWDSTKSDGMPRKLLDSSKIRAMGWSPKHKLEDAFRETYDWYRQCKNV